MFVSQHFFHFIFHSRVRDIAKKASPDLHIHWHNTSPKPGNETTANEPQRCKEKSLKPQKIMIDMI